MISRRWLILLTPQAFVKVPACQSPPFSKKLLVFLHKTCILSWLPDALAHRQKNWPNLERCPVLPLCNFKTIVSKILNVRWVTCPPEKQTVQFLYWARLREPNKSTDCDNVHGGELNVSLFLTFHFATRWHIFKFSTVCLLQCSLHNFGANIILTKCDVVF